MAAGDFLADVLGQDGRVRTDLFSSRLRITKLQLAMAAGLSKDAVSKSARAGAPATQSRLRDVAEVLNRIRSWAGSPEAAFAWYRSQPLSGFGALTAEDLVKQGRAEAVKHHLARIAAGGHA